MFRAKIRLLTSAATILEYTLSDNGPSQSHWFRLSASCVPTAAWCKQCPKNKGILKRTWSVRRKGQGRACGEIPPSTVEQRVVIPSGEGWPLARGDYLGCRSIAELYSAERRVGPTPRRFSTFDNVQLYGTGTVQRSRNPIVLVLLLVLVLDRPISDDENEDDDEDERFVRLATISASKNPVTFSRLPSIH